jgi:hypothetical protein
MLKNRGRGSAILKVDVSALFTRGKAASAETRYQQLHKTPLKQMECTGHCLPTDPTHTFFLVSAELQMGERKEATAADDVLSIGILLFYMLVGRHPVQIRWDRDTYGSWLNRLKEGRVDWPKGAISNPSFKQH